MRFWRTALLTIITVASTLFFAWLTTAINTGDGANPTFFAFMTRFVCLALFFGGIAVTIIAFFSEITRE